MIIYKIFRTCCFSYFYRSRVGGCKDQFNDNACSKRIRIRRCISARLGRGFVSTPEIFRREGDFALEEERRLAYVGITRAKKEAFLSFAMKRAYHGDWMELPSRFINEIPDESVEKNEIGLHDSDDFEFNQDNAIEFDEEYRSPGWDRYKKNKILKWKNK